MIAEIEIREEDPRHPQVIALLEAHLRAMDDQAPGVPKESQHALDVSGLCAPEIAFRAAWAGDTVVGVGALKSLSEGQSESRLMLEHLIDLAQAQGARRVSLETGAQPGFAPSRKLYASAGFVPCPPFADYAPDPNSAFMTRALSE